MRVAGALAGLAAGAWAAGTGCGARSSLYELAAESEPEVDAGADVVVDALPDAPPTGDFCAEKTYETGPTGLSLMVLLDRSLSMLDDSRWALVTSALEAFVEDPTTEGMGMGLQFFPLNPECDVEVYSNPAVPIGKLPGNATGLKNALEGTMPYGKTPTFPALTGAITHARAVALANPQERVVVALVTDGAASSCGSGENVAEAAFEAANTEPQVLTYVISLTSGYEDEVAAIAASGGTGKAIFVDEGAQTMLDAMLGVKLAQENCTYGVPIPAGTQPAATDLAVKYRLAKGGEWTALPLVADFASCSGEAYYVDDLEAPGSATLCPAACATVHGAADSQVTVTAGCGMGTDGGPPDASPDAAGCSSTVDFSCVTGCGASGSTGPSCIDGAWTCPPGTISNEKCKECPVVPHGCCDADGEHVIASCINGAWTCPPGTSAFGEPGCKAPEVCWSTLPCPFDSYCDLPDDSCGNGLLLGTCKPLPEVCSPSGPKACGCNGAIFESDCAAAQSGIDVSGNTDCSVPFGLFPCGGYLCESGAQVCRKTTTFGAKVPDVYTCLDVPPDCGDGCDCASCEVCPPVGQCGTCGFDAPLNGTYLVCTQLAP